jgi:hypothetical protein
MPCTIRCRCGKTTQKFNKLNEGDITTFECSHCPKPEVIEKIEEKPEVIEKPKETKKKKDKTVSE